MSLIGKWYYESFFTSGQDAYATTPDSFQVKPWTPRSVITFSKDGKKVAGDAALGTAKFRFRGTQEGDGSVRLDVTVDGTQTAYLLSGRALKDTKLILGTVMAIKDDLARQPNGSLGPFILFPAE